MGKLKLSYLVIGIIIIVALFSVIPPKKETLVEVVRAVSTTPVTTSSEITIRYISPNSVTAITETIPAGFELVTVSDLIKLKDGTLNIFFTGTTQDVVLRVPSTEGTYIISGTAYDINNIPQILPSQNIIVTNYVKQHSRLCFQGDVYWFDSNNVKNDRVEVCPFFSDTLKCDGNNLNTIKSEKTCLTSVCGSPTEVISSSVTCNWKCMGQSCMRNSNADISNNGVVDVQELMAYARRWVNGEVNIINLMESARVWVSGIEIPKEVI